MAVGLLSQEVSDLCIGKPALKSLPPSATTVADALLAIKRVGEPHLAVLATATEKKAVFVVGKLCLVDVVCFLCSGENIGLTADALARPISALFPKDSGRVRRLEPHFSVLEALDMILEGAEVLVVPIRSAGRKKFYHTAGGDGASTELCWLTQEDFVRYFLNSITLFSPIATLSIDVLGLVRPAEELTVRHYDPALFIVPLLCRAFAEQTGIAVVTDDGKLFGEISPSALAACDESVAAAIATLSAGDLMAYVDYYGHPPDGLVRAIKSGLEEKNLKGMLELMEEESFTSFSLSPSASSSSSDEESGKGSRRRRLWSRSFSVGRRSKEPAVCHPESSLVAVMVQALAQRVRYLWVVDEADCSLIGIVTFADVLKVLREQLQTSF